LIWSGSAKIPNCIRNAWYYSGKEKVSAPVLGTGETAPGVLRSVLGPSLQGRHGVAGACPEKGNEAGEGSREKAFQGVAEVTGAV